MPRLLKRELTGHMTTTVAEAGWTGLRNGALLTNIEGKFDAFITVDKNLPAQQNIGGLSFGLVVLRASNNRLEGLKPLVPQILTALAALQPGQVIHVQ